MGAAITLTVTRGSLKGQKFVFSQKVQCLIGRARDCTIQLQREPGQLDISRHHCVLEIEPSRVQVRDLGSLNGTFVNGRMIGQRSPQEPPEDSTCRDLPAYPLHSGDQVQVGGVVFRVGIGDESHTMRPDNSWCVPV